MNLPEQRHPSFDFAIANMAWAGIIEMTHTKYLPHLYSNNK